ncbi:MAG: DUF4230 domain-containing protein [Acidimicrobiia bacterium]
MKRARSRNPLGLVLIFALATAVLVTAGVGLWFTYANPFAERTTDKSAPALLTRLENLSRYEAAKANFEEIVDVQHSVDRVPASIAGERAQLKAVGDVPAYVDFSSLQAGDITVEGNTVTIRLPHAQVGDAVIDQGQSEVINRDRGLLNRIGDFVSNNPTNDAELYRAAEAKMTAAAASSDLQAKAEANTTAMLSGLMRAAGFDRVNVVYVNAPQ